MSESIGTDELRFFLLKRVHRQEILDHVQSCLPEEACGLVGGRLGQSELVLPIPNLLHSVVRFHMDPQAQLDAFRTLDRLGYDLVAIFHSHPRGPQAPSETDIREFAYPGVLSLICAFEDEFWHVRAFLIGPDRFNEIRLLVD